MIQRSLTRRHFVAGCALAGGALVCAGSGIAFAEGGKIGVAARPENAQIHTICQACPNGCGFTAYTVEGELGKTIGDTSSPRSGGTLCARGFGYTQSAFSSANVKNPMKRKANGSFQTIGWDEAFAEIGAKVTELLDTEGAGSLAAIYDGLAPTTAAYVPRFMAALGSGNAFVDDVTQNVVKEAAFSQVVGVPTYTPDVKNANLVVLVGTSYADVTTPAFVAALQAAREAGTSIVAIDSRLGTLASYADEWIAVNPGTELALLLSVCNGLVQNGLYDKSFVQANVSDFDQWARAIDEYSSDWAEGITGVTSDRIEGLVAKIADAAPRVAIEFGNGEIGAATYANSSETARAVCLLNALVGAWGQVGGALMPFDYDAVSLDAVMPLKNVDELAVAASATHFPLGRPFGASAAKALRLAGSGAITALFAVEANIAYDYANVTDIVGALERLPLFVCITQQMTSTALLADYVLPLSSYLESASLPLFVQGETPAVSIANAVLTEGDSNARSLDLIIESLAVACGVGDAFDFTLDEAAAAQLEVVGRSLEGLRQDGSAALDAGVIKRADVWRTPTGKIQCFSAACEAAGISPMPTWVEPLFASNVQAVISDDMNFGQKNEIDVIRDGGDSNETLFHLVTGQQPVLGPRGYNVAELQDIAEMYDLDSVWINSDMAESLGISTGDAVMVCNDGMAYHGTAFVTQRIVPTAVYMPSGFGHTSTKQREAVGKGANPLLFCAPVVEEGYGTFCTQEALVRLMKEGE